MRGLGSVAAARLEGTGETRPRTDLLRSGCPPAGLHASAPGAVPPGLRQRRDASGKRCRSPAVRGWAVCRMHGARGGAPKGEANGNYKTGEHTAELREARGLSAPSFVGRKTPLELHPLTS